MRLLIQTTIAICYLGNYSGLFIFAVICLTRRKFIQYYRIIHNMLKLQSESSKKEKESILVLFVSSGVICSTFD